jgi:hypothetical protein
MSSYFPPRPEPPKQSSKPTQMSRDEIMEAIAEFRAIHKQNEERDIQTLAELRRILTIIDQKSEHRTQIVETSAKLTGAGVRYIVQIFIITALLVFLWLQLDLRDRNNYVKWLFPSVAVGALAFLGIPVIAASSKASEIRNNDTISANIDRRISDDPRANTEQ